MTATNHALTGAIIGLLVGNPFIALPVAIASHFVCDALPHYGSNTADALYLVSKRFKIMLVCDAALCVLLVICLAITQPEHWFLASICAFLATSPDLIWINHFRLLQAGKKWHPNIYSRFASRIQWFQKPAGAVVEAAWFICGVTIVSMFMF